MRWGREIWAGGGLGCSRGGKGGSHGALRDPCTLYVVWPWQASPTWHPLWLARGDMQSHNARRTNKDIAWAPFMNLGAGARRALLCHNYRHGYSRVDDLQHRFFDLLSCRKEA